MQDLRHQLSADKRLAVNVNIILTQNLYQFHALNVAISSIKKHIKDYNYICQPPDVNCDPTLHISKPASNRGIDKIKSATTS